MDGTIEQNLKDADPWKLLEHESIRQQLIPAMIEATRPLAEQAAKSTITAARRCMKKALGTDLKRLEYLKQVNDNIREEELTHARDVITELDEKLADARLRLDSIRFISAG